MHHKPFGSWAPPKPLGKLTALPRPLAATKGLGPLGKGEEEGRDMGGGKEERGREEEMEEERGW